MKTPTQKNNCQPSRSGSSPALPRPASAFSLSVGVPGADEVPGQRPQSARPAAEPTPPPHPKRLLYLATMFFTFQCFSALLF